MRKVVYGIIVVLVLEVIKTALTKIGFSYSFFVGMIIAALQFMVVLSLFMVPLFVWVLKKFLTNGKVILIAWILFIAQLIILEAVCAYTLFHPRSIPGFLKPSYTYYYKYYIQHILQFDKMGSIYDDRLYYTLKPASSFNFVNYEFNTWVTTNRSGVRDDTGSLEQPEIICLGDSFTMGWGVGDQETFPQQIEKITGKKVLNAGIPSYGTAREVLSLSKFDLSHLKYLVIQYCTNDDGENRSFKENRFSLPVSSRNDFERTARSHALNRRYFPMKHFTTLSQLFLKKKINTLYPLFSLNEAPEQKAIINNRTVETVLEIVTKAPVDLSAVKILLFQLDEPSKMTGDFAVIADSLVHHPYLSHFGKQLKVLDFTHVIGRGDYYQLDPHLTVTGNAKVARTIAGSLE